MMSEKKNKFSTPESVGMGELKRTSKENMNSVRQCSLDFSVCCRKEEIDILHLFYCFSGPFNMHFSQSFDLWYLLSINFH
jgi:hypothetical protein